MPSFSAHSLRAIQTLTRLLTRRLCIVTKLSKLEGPTPPTELAKFPHRCGINAYQTKVMMTEPHARHRAVGATVGIRGW